MLNFVLWSLTIAVTPWALGLALMLISGIGDLIGFRRSRALAETRRERLPSSSSVNRLSNSGSMAGRSTCSSHAPVA
jgi:hypothetical protein